MQLNILVLDDERLNRNYIRDLILECDPSANVQMARSVDQSLEILRDAKIDILFSDVRMPGENSFDLLKQLPEREFELVFITAYKEYAIQAIKEGASDYLLKPVKKSEFAEMFKKVVAKVEEKQKESISISEAPDDTYQNKRLTLGHQQGIRFITLRDIIYLEAQNSYTNIYLVNGEKVTVSKPIMKFEETLDINWFFRIHKSYIANIFHFREYVSKNGDIAVMDNGDKLIISRYRLSQFLEVVENMSGRLKV